MEGGEAENSNGDGISTTASKSSRKQLIFDRRYGWVYDEWKSPAEVALVGGRGMFCIVPLSKAAAKLALERVNIAADSLVQRLDSPSYPRSPHAWFKLAKDMVKRNSQNWFHGLVSFGKSFFISLSRFKAINLPNRPKNSFVPSLLQYKESKKGETESNN